MNTRLIFIRHGFSESNQNKLFTGQADIPLTELGIKQAQCAAEYLKNTKIDQIYSSTLSRAIRTAEAISVPRGMDIVRDKGLCEIFSGDWTMMPFDQIQFMYPIEYDNWHNDMYNCTCPNGESVSDFAKRVINTVLKISTQNIGKTVVIVSHATPIRIISCLALGEELKDLKSVPWSPNASINIIDCDGKNFRFVKRDIVDHLKDFMTNLPKNI